MTIPPRSTVFLLAAAACTGGDTTDSVPDLPAEETGWVDTDTGPFVIPDDTANNPDLNEEPAHWLYLYQEGSWLLSPSGGPYTAMTGTLEVYEIIDYERPDPLDTGPLPWDTGDEDPIVCEVTYNLIGSPVEEQYECSTCLVTFDVEFNVTSGDPAQCRNGDLPPNGATRRFGYDASAAAIQFDYYHSGVWFPWFAATKAGDTVTYSWTGKYGVSVEEDDQ